MGISNCITRESINYIFFRIAYVREKKNCTIYFNFYHIFISGVWYLVCLGSTPTALTRPIDGYSELAANDD